MVKIPPSSKKNFGPGRHSCCHAARAADHIDEQNIKGLVEFAGVSAVVQVYQSAYELAIVAVRNR
jgi:hypothetical protein